jgi:hypothetical protein
MNPAIEYHEKIVKKITLRANDFYKGDLYCNYRKRTSLHNFTVAYGTPAQAMGCFCSTRIGADFEMRAVAKTPTEKDRFMLKLVACWQDDTGDNHPVTIKINNHDVYGGPLFLENVCKGWPAIYFDVDACVIQEGVNNLEIINNSGRGVLIVSKAEILTRPKFRHFTIRSCPDFVLVDEKFNVCLNLAFNSSIDISYPKQFIEFIENKNDQYVFKALKSGKKIELVFYCDDHECRAIIEDIYPSKDCRVFVGFNADDTRHDNVGELERQLANIAETQIGNFFAFRFQSNRTHSSEYTQPENLWFEWINYCVNKGLFFQFSINRPDVNIQEIMDAGGDFFCGIQLHELYLVFQPPVEINGVLNDKKDLPNTIVLAKDFEQKKQAYLDYIKGKLEKSFFKETSIHLGDPSLLCIYSKHTKADGILCEVVTNSGLLFGAARKTGKEFGSHIAGDWYLGSQHDDNAIRRIQLLMNLTYAYGGNWVTIESTLFKTNAMHRCDWEDDFCVKARQSMRDFYRFSCQDNRSGKVEVPLAFVYGNLESIFWLEDDRLPELIDIKDWDTKVWGKWNDIGSRKLWKATNGWLKHLQFTELGRDERLTMMFSGTPYGQVDIVLPSDELSDYKAISFLGWNSMNKPIYDNLKSYVINGGILVICGCHFDTRISFDQEVEMFNGGDLQELLGVRIEGMGDIVVDGVHSCRIKNLTAEKIDEDYFINHTGQGKVYFFNYFDYPSDPRLIKKIENVLDEIGNEISRNSDFVVEGENAKFMNYNIWNDGLNKKLYISNIDWENTDGRQVNLRCGSNIISEVISGGQTKVIEL